MRTSKRLAVNVERDSVGAGDDIFAPHAKRFAFQARDTLADVLSAILVAGYLAKIAGGKATWIVEAAGKPVAVVAQQWGAPKFLIDQTSLVTDCVTPEAPRALFFRYWCQLDPAVVFQCLRLGQPLPDRYGRDE
ncbi:MAG: hypothetical protein JWN70_4481 [Planctomycetaceae bacterium]|nr:hypothetical protein [Planctomycetaceae bacterium]